MTTLNEIIGNNAELIPNNKVFMFNNSVAAVQRVYIKSVTCQSDDRVVNLDMTGLLFCRLDERCKRITNFQPSHCNDRRSVAMTCAIPSRSDMVTKLYTCMPILAPMNLL